MQIEYTYSHINDPDGSVCKSGLDDFILRLPNVGMTIRKSKVIPPFEVVNELLNLGKCDAGMSGVFEWKPVQLEIGEYEILKECFRTQLGEEAANLNAGKVTLKKWVSLARSHYVKLSPRK